MSTISGPNITFWGLKGNGADMRCTPSIPGRCGIRFNVQYVRKYESEIRQFI